MVAYLDKKITQARRGSQPSYGLTADGYTKRSGAPTSIQVQLEGEKRWRRVFCWQFSNAATLFVKVKGLPLVVSPFDIPEIA